jgi:hypothetical protein
MGITYAIIYIVRGKPTTISGQDEKGGTMEDMGMTDKQFNGFVRFLLDDLKEIEEEKDEIKKAEKIKKVIENLQKTLED